MQISFSDLLFPWHKFEKLCYEAVLTLGLNLKVRVILGSGSKPCQRRVGRFRKRKLS